MPLPARRHPVSARFPDVLDWLESPWSAMLPFRPAQTFRVEDYTEDGKYVIRAELPGLDPDDVQVTVESGMLTIRAERREETKQNRHSEFKYGSLTRSYHFRRVPIRTRSQPALTRESSTSPLRCLPRQSPHRARSASSGGANRESGV